MGGSCRVPALHGKKLVGVVVRHERRLGSLEHDAHAHVLETVGIGVGVAPDQEEILAVLLVLVSHFQGIRRLAVIDECESPAAGGHGLGSVDLHRPVDKVDDVAAEVGQQAAAVVPEPAPVEQ